MWKSEILVNREDVCDFLNHCRFNPIYVKVVYDSAIDAFIVFYRSDEE